MEIIKRGKSKEQLKAILNETKRFKCRTCGCIFKADKGEYRVDSDYDCSRYYYCNCPNCGMPAYEAKKR